MLEDVTARVQQAQQQAHVPRRTGEDGLPAAARLRRWREAVEPDLPPRIAAGRRRVRPLRERTSRCGPAWNPTGAATSPRFTACGPTCTRCPPAPPLHGRVHGEGGQILVVDEALLRPRPDGRPPAGVGPQPHGRDSGREAMRPGRIEAGAHSSAKPGPVSFAAVSTDESSGCLFAELDVRGHCAVSSASTSAASVLPWWARRRRDCRSSGSIVVDELGGGCRIAAVGQALQLSEVSQLGGELDQFIVRGRIALVGKTPQFAIFGGEFDQLVER